jgi:FtsH-binding integral membrane protein
VAGFCVLAATLVALVTIEGDRLAPPLSVAVIGTGIASALLVAAGVADRRWHHVVGVVVGVAVAGLLVALTRRRRAGEDDRSPLMVAAPVLLPVGAALGWLGPVYVGEGLAATVVVFVAASAMQRTHRSSKPDPGRVVVGFALAAGVGVALVIAVAVGAGAGT